MSLLSEDVGNHAPGHAITHDGETYVFRHLGLADLARYERESFRARRDALRDLKDDFGPEEYGRRIADLYERYERHEFSFEKDAGRRSNESVLLLLQIMTGRTEGEASRLFCAQTDEVGRLMQLVIEESFGRPKAQAGPAAPAAGR